MLSRPSHSHNDWMAKTNDLVVLLPGIMGSTLRRDGKDVWAPSPQGAVQALRTLGGSIKDLALPTGIGDDHPDDGVEPGLLMPDLHVIPGIWTAQIGYQKIFAWLQRTLNLVSCGKDGMVAGNLLAVPYDWRLSNRHNGRRLKSIVEPALDRWRTASKNADAQLIFICHSMGGLIARWYIHHEGGVELTRKLITLGTPHRGSAKALEHLVNGVKVGRGQMGVDLTEFARSLPSLHQLLPEYACIATPATGANLMKTTEVELPELSSAMVTDGMRFHDELDDAAGDWTAHGFDFHPIVGQNQSTVTTATLSYGALSFIPTIQGANERGDGTVPRLSAIPRGLMPSSPTVRYVTERHGHLHHNRSLFDELEGVLTASQVSHRAVESTAIDVHIDDVADYGQPLTIRAELVGDESHPLTVSLVTETGQTLPPQKLLVRGETHVATLNPPTPGAYVVKVEGFGNAAQSLVTPVSTPVFVWGEA